MSMASLPLPAITFRSPTSSTLAPSVPMRLSEAPLEIATPPPKMFPSASVSGWVPLLTFDHSGDVGPDEVARHRVVTRPCPGDPDTREQVAAEQVALGRVVDTVAVGADRFRVAPPSISTPSSFGSACVPVGSMPRKMP